MYALLVSSADFGWAQDAKMYAVLPGLHALVELQRGTCTWVTRISFLARRAQMKTQLVARHSFEDVS